MTSDERYEILAIASTIHYLGGKERYSQQDFNKDRDRSHELLNDLKTLTEKMVTVWSIDKLRK